MKPIEKLKKIGLFFFYEQLKKRKLKSAEPEFNILKKFLKKNENVIDIGANIGRYSFELSSIVGKNGTVYSFEPILRSYLIFISLIFLRRVKNIIPFNFALSDKSKFLNMREVKTQRRSTAKKMIYNTYTGSKVIKNGNITQYANKLDNLKISKKISFIKIDCEGHELEVLKGSIKTIKKNKPILLVQNTHYNVSKYLKSTGYKQAQIPLKKARKNYLFMYKTQKKLI